MNTFVEEEFNLKSVNGIFIVHLTSFLSEMAELDVSRHVFECLGLAMPMSRLGP